jgi:beta-lactamase class D OXA-211
MGWSKAQLPCLGKRHDFRASHASICRSRLSGASTAHWPRPDEKEVQRIGYGNQQIGTVVDNFWLVGPLQITPVQEVLFVEKLANTQLAFKPDVQHAVQDMLLIEQKPNYKLYAKSGWGMDLEPQVGWWTGWVETATGEKVYFALNMHMKTGISASVREQLVKQSLTALGII